MATFAFSACVKNDISDVNIDGEIYTEDFFIINGSEHDITLHYVPFEGVPADINLPIGDTLSIRSYGKGDVMAAPFVGKVYIAFEKEEWVPFYAYVDKRKDITYPTAYDRQLIKENYYQSTYSLEEADYNYWLKIKEEAEQ